MDLIGCAALVVLCSAAVWAGSSWVDRASEHLAAHHGLSPAVQGALLAAVASSVPELFTAVVATWLHGAFDLGVAAIVGSAVFNILVIPALARLWGGGLVVEREILQRDAQFYLLAVAGLYATFAAALVYRPQAEPGVAELDRGLALLPLALYGLYLFWMRQDLCLRPAPRERVPAGGLHEWGRLAAGLGLILLAVEGLVRSALWLGETFAVPVFLWGATVVAAATSLPDLVISVRTACRGAGDVSLGNVFGSNSFDLLVAVPAGVLVAGAAAVSLPVATPMMAFLAGATLALYTALRTRRELGRGAAWGLLVLYAAFVGWIALEAVGALRWTRAGA